MGIVDASGNEVVKYAYDAWGKPLYTTGVLAGTLGYYLRSRYYNPEWGRFLNADAKLGGKGNLLSHNAFAYCKNSMVNRADQSGNTDYKIYNPFALSFYKTFYFLAGNAFLQIKGYDLAASMYSHAFYGGGRTYPGNKEQKKTFEDNIANDEGLKSCIENDYISNMKNGERCSSTLNYEFSKGDLFYALQKATIYIDALKTDSGWTADITIVDTYDFTENRVKKEGWSFANVANDLGNSSVALNIMTPYDVLYTVNITN